MGDLSAFSAERNATLDRVLALVEMRLDAVKTPIVTDIREISMTDTAAEKESWFLVGNAVRHLKDGAPGYLPGSMAEALTKISLRSSTLAASLGVKPPQFEQMLFQADYADGRDAAIFMCQRLIEAAEGDAVKSRQIIAHKILLEKPELSPVFAQASKEDLIAFKKQMALSLDMLLHSYAATCKHVRNGIEAF